MKTPISLLLTLCCFTTALFVYGYDPKGEPHTLHTYTLQNFAEIQFPSYFSGVLSKIPSLDNSNFPPSFFPYLLEPFYAALGSTPEAITAYVLVIGCLYFISLIGLAKAWNLPPALLLVWTACTPMQLKFAMMFDHYALSLICINGLLITLARTSSRQVRAGWLPAWTAGLLSGTLFTDMLTFVLQLSPATALLHHGPAKKQWRAILAMLLVFSILALMLRIQPRSPTHENWAYTANYYISELLRYAAFLSEPQTYFAYCFDLLPMLGPPFFVLLLLCLAVGGYATAPMTTKYLLVGAVISFISISMVPKKNYYYIAYAGYLLFIGGISLCHCALRSRPLRSLRRFVWSTALAAQAVFTVLAFGAYFQTPKAAFGLAAKEVEPKVQSHFSPRNYRHHRSEEEFNRNFKHLAMLLEQSKASRLALLLSHQPRCCQDGICSSSDIFYSSMFFSLSSLAEKKKISIFDANMAYIFGLKKAGIKDTDILLISRSFECSQLKSRPILEHLLYMTIMGQYLRCSAPLLASKSIYSSSPGEVAMVMQNKPAAEKLQRHLSFLLPDIVDVVAKRPIIAFHMYNPEKLNNSVCYLPANMR